MKLIDGLPCDRNSQLETDPKARRVSVQGSQQIRASFDRIHREMVDEEDLSIDWGKVRPAFSFSFADPFLLDSDFWGRVMSDYEEVASTQRR